MSIRSELIDELLAGHDPASIMRQDGLLGELKKALLNRVMAAGFEQHMTFSDESRPEQMAARFRCTATRPRIR